LRRNGSGGGRSGGRRGGGQGGLALLVSPSRGTARLSSSSITTRRICTSELAQKPLQPAALGLSSCSPGPGPSSGLPASRACPSSQRAPTQLAAERAELAGSAVDPVWSRAALTGKNASGSEKCDVAEDAAVGEDWVVGASAKEQRRGGGECGLAPEREGAGSADR